MAESDKFNPEKVAREVIQFVMDACGDMAFDVSQSAKEGYFYGDKKLKKFISDLKKSGCKDISGSLADWYYNDPATLQDLMGDRIHDEIVQQVGYNKDVFNKQFVEVCSSMMKSAHKAMKEALTKMIKDHNKGV